MVPGEQTASALLDSALSAMLAQQSVHMACTTSSSTGSNVDTVNAGVAAQTVYIAATGAPLPVSETIHGSDGTSTCDYSGWGKPLHLTVPANVIPVTAIPK